MLSSEKNKRTYKTCSINPETVSVLFLSCQLLDDDVTGAVQTV